MEQGGEATDHPLTLPPVDAPALIAYTSGTTGRSKGAVHLHRSLSASAAAVASAWRWTGEDVLLLTLPLFHLHGLCVGLQGALSTGSSVFLRARFDAADVLGTLDGDPSVSLFFGVPTMYARLVGEAARRGVPRHLPRVFVSGSAPLAPKLFFEFERVFGCRILERYGMTETIMNLTNPYDGERRAGTVGMPFPGQEARVVDVRTRQALPAGEVGEIEVRGPHVFAGYWQRPDATTEALGADGWFKTADLGSCSADGYFAITGRLGELIISGGYNVYPREVEDVLSEHPAIAEVAVIGMPDADLGEQVVAVVVPKEGFAPSADDCSADDIIAFCRERLASYKKPRRVLFVEALPRNALGKVQKQLLALEASSNA
jgi:malonyl-CoA/methylmalonyl-CoA synthetase